MYNGVLLAAFDTVTDSGKPLQYRRQAQICANLVRRHLDCPVALITDSYLDGFDHVIKMPAPPGNKRSVPFNDIHETFSWKNDVRRAARNLTPFDRTLMLDVDYFVLTDRLNPVLDSDEPFMIIHDVHHPKDPNYWKHALRLPDNTIPQTWATAMAWTSGDADIHFDYADSVADNYAYYAALLGFPTTPYRNDMVFSIVAHTLGSAPIPGSTLTIPSPYLPEPTKHKPDWLTLHQPNDYRADIYVTPEDVHILSKTLVADPVLLERLHQWSS